MLCGGWGTEAGVCGAQVSVIKGDKGAEDWDHEANAADDDEDMGEQDDPNNRDASPPPRQSVSSLSCTRKRKNFQDALPTAFEQHTRSCISLLNREPNSYPPPLPTCCSL